MPCRVIIRVNCRARRFWHWSRHTIKGRIILTQHEILLSFPATHPVFSGHFPGHPIVPGVMLVDEAIHAIESAIGQTIMAGGQITASKFYSPVSPGDLLSLRFDIRQDKTIVFEIYENKRKIAAGNLKPATTLDLC
ncbi:hypothetical protein [Acidithiobacillus sulfurivorans]|uniref:ApeI dehydratase-like domain-containing protein n=1 Tax=Acidithiobacillus sulfurivorans TaxID=1958756 RepID=A0ABS5ZW46_9PROT|nr:hypothetical protein [Acidithiobacillus sulfurivorans]MBU2759442.1 hypothetical protein [Acidithiobacillus sulfurivorans]